MTKGPDGWKVYDVIVENLSLVTNYRSSFASEIQRSGIDGLIKVLQAKHGTPHPIEGVSLNGRLGVIYSQDGLNDTAHAPGCCCCGGNEITNCLQVNVNILAYALIY